MFYKCRSFADQFLICTLGTLRSRRRWLITCVLYVFVHRGGTSLCKIETQKDTLVGSNASIRSAQYPKLLTGRRKLVRSFISLGCDLGWIKWIFFIIFRKFGLRCKNQLARRESFYINTFCSIDLLHCAKDDVVMNICVLVAHHQRNLK